MKSVLIAAAALLLPLISHGGPSWVLGTSQIPVNAVYAGEEKGLTNWVCRAYHLGAVHPGKFFAGHCNIEFAGQELILDEFDMLAADSSAVSWVDAEQGAFPENAFPTGDENGKQLYSCRAEVFGADGSELGLHAGKLIGPGCNIPYGGANYFAAMYAVLVIADDVPTGLRPRARASSGTLRLGGTRGFDLSGRALPERTRAAAVRTSVFLP